MTKREKLLDLLADVADGTVDMSVAHREAEDLLLALLGDTEISEAWDDAADFWWYA